MIERWLYLWSALKIGFHRIRHINLLVKLPLTWLIMHWIVVSVKIILLSYFISGHGKFLLIIFKCDWHVKFRLNGIVLRTCLVKRVSIRLSKLFSNVFISFQLFLQLRINSNLLGILFRTWLFNAPR